MYLGVAGGLGVSWYGAMLIPRLTGALLLEDSRRCLSLFVGISIVLASLSKRFVLGPMDPERAFLVAIVTPLAGSVLFVWLITALDWVASPASQPVSPGQSVSMLIFLTVFRVLTVFATAFYVIVPMGVLSLLVMRKVGQLTWQGPLAARHLTCA